MSTYDDVHKEAMADYRATSFDSPGGADDYITRDEIIPWTDWIKKQRRDDGVYDLMDRVDRGEYEAEYEGEWLERQDTRHDR